MRLSEALIQVPYLNRANSSPPIRISRDTQNKLINNCNLVVAGREPLFRFVVREFREQKLSNDVTINNIIYTCNQADAGISLLFVILDFKKYLKSTK